MAIDEEVFSEVARESRRLSEFEEFYANHKLPEDVELAVKILYYHNPTRFHLIKKDIKRSRGTGLKRTLSNLMKDLPEIFSKENKLQQTPSSAIISLANKGRVLSPTHLSVMRNHL